jgi:hypothetical protein
MPLRAWRFESSPAHQMDYKTEKFSHIKPPIAVDFDGVIHTYSRGFDDGSIYDGPMPGVIEALTFLKEKYYIYIFSNRSGTPEGKVAIEEFLQANRIPFDEVSMTKPPAKFYIDDRAVRFKNWTQTLDDIEKFEKELGEK